MEIYTLKNVSFTYPGKDAPAIENINLSVKNGEFMLLCGKSGCGKTTLLRLLKSALSPHGSLTGEILYSGTPLAEVDGRAEAAEIGFVLQSPDSQIVTDKVWHELAFGPESLGMKNAEIRTRVAEIASFFGIQNWFYKKTSELSGGQKQLLNLASVMVMRPEVLILDEPTAQLDPIAASEFLNTLKKINRELGTTVILTEHRLEEGFAMADRVLVMDEGHIIAEGTPQSVAGRLNESGHPMADALPVPIRVFAGIDGEREYPITVGEGKIRLSEYAAVLDKDKVPKDKEPLQTECVIEVKDAYFRYEKNLPDVIRKLNLKVNKGEFYALLGGNGTGKTTAVSLISGLNKPQRGKIYINGGDILKKGNLYDRLLGVLPQTPRTLFTKSSVYADLMEMTDPVLTDEEREVEVRNIACLCGIENLLDSHPYDLSGGEQQRTALAMVLLRHPEIIILDEPTKGMDAHFKQIFGDILLNLKMSGVTIFAVSHDIEFCAEYADRCALMFDGAITSEGTPRQFFCGNSFYTTGANRMAGKLLPDAILAEDIILAAGGKPKPKEKGRGKVYTPAPHPADKKSKPKLTLKRIVTGIIFLVCFASVCILQNTDFGMKSPAKYILQGGAILFAALGISALAPGREFKSAPVKSAGTKLTKRTVAAVITLVLIPATIYYGMAYLDNRKYYFVSLLIILETMLPFFMVFEKRKPRAREIVIISVLCGLAVAGRTAFYTLPEFKPVVALVIISGICLGGETGFLVGSISGFVSNFFFGQGPWTPWQMFAFGIIGFIAGVVFKKGLLPKTRVSLALFGFVTTLVIYGGIMNTSSVFFITTATNAAMIKSVYLMGLPMDLIHAASSAFFLWFLAEPMTEKLERVKVKYGLI